ncbi:G-protein coupled receptor Mth2 isoform X2 [Eurytemora carolleeae]|uniref:G-protein coupled receptor Mth2 isoform X2 n=1 Tax=Eurytemora carolleeae TaxID=1294199 RepID=UPI000C75AF20|nr:G-protein coupled receptor Mth2 isoform X2 [Eurytemora carolleeae]|eukprot:XP_023347761.1 G-protein coupled receptor Mth2-like isoform X2 [Eurytemora affinis]
MFWINAMAASICFKFSSILSTQTDNEKKRFIMNFLYAQGLPVVLCIIIAEIDRYGSCSWIRPDMGVAQCFIGTPRGEMMGASSFFKTAEFMYFQGILLVLQITNIIFFLITVYFLVDHWRKSSYITKTGENKGNFLIVVKLFFIMGIPWLGELLSHSLTHVMGPDASFYYRVVIDCANLFTGVLVFLVLVCKKKTVTRVRTRLQHNSQLSRGSTLTTSTKDTVQWDKDSVHQTRDTRGGDQLRLKVFFRNQQQQTAGSIRSTSNQEDYL